MSQTRTTQKTPALSIIHGIPLAEEQGLGALTLPGFLREVTARYGPREALVFYEGGHVERWSYDTLWARAMAVARALTACGVGKDSRVGIMMTNRPEWIAAFFGTALAGGVAVTISTFSTPQELEYLLQAGCVSVLLFEGRVLKKDFAEILYELEPGIRNAAPGKLQSTKFPFLRYFAGVGVETAGPIESWDQYLKRGEAIAPATIEAAFATTKPSDTAALFFSSGSTSKAKGILSMHRGIALQAWRWPHFYGLEGDVRCWSANGFFWSGNFCQSLGATLSVGGALVLQKTFIADEALSLMDKEKVNLAVAWPHQWAQLETASNWNEVNLSSLHYVDAATKLAQHPTVSTTWREPRWAYGSTETFTISAIFPANTPEEITGNSHGIPLPGNAIKIVDAITGETVPMGERGEIAVKGPTLMIGYIGVPPEETFDDEGFFLTGDGGYIDEKGRLVWEGRLTDIIKTGGANVSPLEIDEVLNTYPGIRVGRTVGVPHETLGEMVVACIVPHEGRSLEEDSIRDFLKEKLASYKVPRRVLFFTNDELAMTGSAKIKSNTLRQLASERLKAR